ncbi:MAG: FKBP-type peptidyl-prolyl cis-trans isomerase [Candidatus Altiarchaeota archaeon]|nr:FKBP-type peptidyl-prolyl cis-trans isomerase [Candidatus Altiarchaeota archaeon]
MTAKGDKTTTVILALIFITVLAALLFLIIKQAEKDKTDATLPATTLPGSAKPAATTTRPANSAITAGDIVEVDYIGTYTDGRVFDTSLEDRAVAAGIYDEERAYQPIVFTVGLGEVVPGIEDAVMGMKAGEGKTVVITPESGYGEWSPDNIDVVSRIQNTSRIENVSLEIFQNVTGKTPTIGEEIKLPQMRWPITILDIKDGFVFMQHNPTDGMLVPTDLGNSSLTVIGDRIYAKLEVREGDRVATSIGYVKIINVTDETVTIDANHELAGKNVTFEIKVVSVNQKEDPYAQQIQALAEAYQAAGVELPQ